jgi:hypothetical protein
VIIFKTYTSLENEEIDKFLDTHDTLKFNQEDINNLNRYITINDIETVTKKLPTKKKHRPS